MDNDNIKKPRGIKRSRKQLEQSSDANANADPLPSENAVAQVIMEGPAGEDEDLRALFDAACSNLHSDIDNSAALFRAVIHECDRLLKLQNEAGSSSSPLSETAIASTDEFHHIYAMALFYHSQLEDSLAETEVSDYLDFALEQMEKCSSESISRNADIALDYGRILITIAGTDRSDDVLCNAFVSKACDNLSIAASVLNTLTNNPLKEQEVSSVLFVKFISLSLDIASVSEMRELSLAVFDDILTLFISLQNQFQDEMEFLKAHASVLMSKACLLADQELADSALQEFTLARDKLDRAYSLLPEVEDKSDAKVELLVDLCNVNLQMGNLLAEIGKDGDSYHRNAIEYYDQGKGIDASVFPQDFEELMDELKQGLCEGESK